MVELRQALSFDELYAADTDIFIRKRNRRTLASGGDIGGGEGLKADGSSKALKADGISTAAKA